MEYSGVEYDKVYFVNVKKDIVDKVIPIMEEIEKDNFIDKIFKNKSEKRKIKLKKQWTDITNQDYPFLMSIVDVPLAVDLTILKDLKKIQSKKNKSEKLQLDLNKELSRIDAEEAKEKYPKAKFKISDMFNIN